MPPFIEGLYIFAGEMLLITGDFFAPHVMNGLKAGVFDHDPGAFRKAVFYDGVTNLLLFGVGVDAPLFGAGGRFVLSAFIKINGDY